MAVTHIVAFTWIEGTDDATVAALDADLHALVAQEGEFPGLVSWHGGRDLALAPGTADYGVAAVFTDRAAYEHYRDHAGHRRIVTEQVTPLLASRSASQFFD